VLKNRHAPELSEANCHARLNHSKQLSKNIRASDVSIIYSLAHWRKRYLQWPRRKQTYRMRPIVLTCSDQEKRCRNKTPAFTIDADCRHQEWSTIHQFDRSWVTLINAYYCNVLLLQQFLPATSQLFGEWFIFRQCLTPSTFLLLSSPDADRF